LAPLAATSSRSAQFSAIGWNVREGSPPEMVFSAGRASLLPDFGQRLCLRTWTITVVTGAASIWDQTVACGRAGRARLLLCFPLTDPDRTVRRTSNSPGGRLAPCADRPGPAHRLVRGGGRNRGGVRSRVGRSPARYRRGGRGRHRRTGEQRATEHRDTRNRGTGERRALGGHRGTRNQRRTRERHDTWNRRGAGARRRAGTDPVPRARPPTWTSRLRVHGGRGRL